MLISLFELQNDETTLRKIVRSLPLQLLKQNLSLIYKKYMKIYDSLYIRENFKHVFYNLNLQKIFKIGNIFR